MFLLVYVVLSLVSGCKSAVSTKTTSRDELGKTKVDKPGLPKPGEVKRSATEQGATEGAISALKLMKENAPKVRLNEYFNEIVNADNATAADNAMAKALTMFASPKTTVLLETADQNGNSNYEKPTTILAYFNYLKMQKKNLDDIKNLKIDNQGKIIEVALRKNNSMPMR